MGKFSQHSCGLGFEKTGRNGLSPKILPSNGLYTCNAAPPQCRAGAAVHREADRQLRHHDSHAEGLHRSDYIMTLQHILPESGQDRACH